LLPGGRRRPRRLRLRPAAALAKVRALGQISGDKLLILKPKPGKTGLSSNEGQTGDDALARIDAFLKLGTQQGCSDVHLAVGVPPMLRMHGDLLPIKFRDLRAVELEGYIAEILTRSQNETFSKGNDLDFSYVSADGGRFRVNVYRKETGVGATFRSIPAEVPTLEKLQLPPIVTKLCDYHQGMILVTGSTGTGKSTTLAAMIDHLNQTRKLNIISLEDPIEFVHRSKNSQVIQRELNTHIPSFAEGVRAAMREDPDVILVGELRDAETITMAMTAAETGHLVLGTLHTTSAVKTIDRVIDALPVEEREQTKSFLSQSLLAVVTQILVKTADAKGRKAICESLVMTKAIAKLIQSDQTHQIPTQMQMGRDVGMQLLDQALLTAITAREIDPDDAYSYAMDKRAFQKYVTDTTVLPKIDAAAPAATPPASSAASA
jgi:twitching motility protein PilT